MTAPTSGKKEPTDMALQQARYYGLNGTEKCIVDGWVKGGMSLKTALDTLYSDLADAAEEDGYAGP